MRRVLVPFLALLMLLPFIPAAAQGDDLPCADGTYRYGRELNVRYDREGIRYILTDAAEGFEVAVLYDAPVVEPLPTFYRVWSPNCNYVVAQVGSEGLFVWEVSTGHLLRHFDQPAFTNWNQEGDSLFVTVFDDDLEMTSTATHFYWNIERNSYVPIGDASCYVFGDSYRDPSRIAVDETQGVILLRPAVPDALGRGYCLGLSSIEGYSTSTGELVESYTDLGSIGVYELSADARYLIVSRAYRNDTLIIDRETGQQRVVVFNDVSGIIANSRTDLSPNGRYLAIGINYIRVWDLQNLQQDDEGVTIVPYRHEGPSGRVWSLRWLDDSTIETQSIEGSLRWNAFTGEPITN